MRTVPSVSLPAIARSHLCCALLVLAGCSLSEPPEFRLNTEGRDPAEISIAQAETISDVLRELFGTPDEPAIPPGIDLRLPRLQLAAGAVGVDAEGVQRGLYRQHCTACHGTPGDGAGPTAALMNPYPRDFRNGVYKYTSTAGGAKPAWEDLQRVLLRGMPGTSMPSFSTLADEQIEALVEYVEYLSIRGETELYLLQLVVDENERFVDVHDVVADGTRFTADQWAAAAKNVVRPPPQPSTSTPEAYADSVARGYKLFSSKNTQCVSCHGTNGRGDGEQADQLYDDWNKGKKGATAEETRRLAGRFRLPIHKLRPRDFTKGLFRGGDEPTDIFWRVHVGIKGTPMPAGGPAPGSRGVLTPEQIWDVVSYVRSRAGDPH